MDDICSIAENINRTLFNILGTEIDFINLNTNNLYNKYTTTLKKRRAQRKIINITPSTGIFRTGFLEESKALIPRKKKKLKEMWHYSTSSKSLGM
ncbi:BBT_HP_G0018080.mRNA.1.CDS.1 [Saccharomyces cerevisiae]|nr:BBT_HP_G0018080.mRNA.1.CDS.1 [Saccharomyces cerevisiae]CAI6398006.1 BBT_HP_G0018080.mRNA.1.CDS.1 [Saccharomyces cerevisiae]